MGQTEENKVKYKQIYIEVGKCSKRPKLFRKKPHQVQYMKGFGYRCIWCKDTYLNIMNK